MKKFTLAAFTAMLAVFAAHAADYYQFSVGQAIPLFDSEKSVLSHVLSGDNIGYESTEHFGSTKNGSSLTLYLKNETAGTYYLTLLGANSNNSASSYTLTVENEGGTYKRESGKVVQPKTTDWAIVTPGGIKLDDLPAGNFTVKMEISMTSGSWAGNYGKFTIYKNVYDTSVNTGDNSVFVLDNDDTMTSNWYSPTGNSKDKQNEFGNFSSNPTISLYFYVAEKGVYEMSYSARVNDNEPTTAAWTLIGNGASAEFTDNIKTTGGNWENIAYYTNSVGVLSKGFYRVEGKITSNNAWRGYYGNFRFTQTAECKTVAAGETWELDADTTLAELTVGEGATIDLCGYSLTVYKSEMTDAASGKFCLVTNSVNETLSTFTIGAEGNAATLAQYAHVGGNLRYVIQGQTGGRFVQNVVNTHTGGTVLDGSYIDDANTKQIYFDSGEGNGFFGTEEIVFKDGTYARWEGQYGGDLEYTNNIVVEGEGNWLETERNWTAAAGGTLTGDGTLRISCGWAPSIYLRGDATGFTGTLACAYSANESAINQTRGIYLGNETSCAYSNATIEIVHRTDNNASYGSVVHIDQSADAYLGNLTTDTDSVDDQQYSILYGHREGGTTLHIGGRNEDGTFAGLIKEYQDSDSYTVSVDKVGTGTWTIKAAQTYKGATTVSGGSLILAMDEFTNSVVTVKSGAMIGGTAVIDNIVFDGGALADEDAGVKVKTYTGWPSLNAESQAANATDTKGKWRIVKSYDQTTNLTTFKRQYFKNGLVIIFR